MAGAPAFKVYDAHKRYMAATKEPEAAVLLTGDLYGPGSTIRYDGHTISDIIFTEGVDGNIGNDGTDALVDLIYKRLDARWEKRGK